MPVLMLRLWPKTIDVETKGWMSIVPEMFISPSTCAMTSMKSPSVASMTDSPAPVVIGVSEPESMTFLVWYEKTGFVTARIPISPAHWVGSSASPVTISARLEKLSEKRTEFARSGEESLASALVKPQGANCCVAFES